MVLEGLRRFILLTSILCVTGTFSKGLLAAIPPEDPRILVDQFVAEIDTRAEMRFEQILVDESCPPKGADTYTACECDAVYAISKIVEKPESLGLKKGDRLEIRHPCFTEGFASRKSFFPWAEVTGDGTILLTIPSDYLVPLEKDQWRTETYDIEPVIPGNIYPRPERD